MGRGFGGNIYDSGMALDYHATITDRLERELAYWFSPEQVMNGSYWLAQVLTILEIMLLFEEHSIGSSVYLDQEQAIQRWRQVLMNVWDSDWTTKREGYNFGFVFDDPGNRKLHRAAIAKMFDRLESIARFWTNVTHSKTDLVPLLPDYPLPYFSIHRWTNQDNKNIVSVERVFHDLVRQLHKDIVYWLASERRDQVMKFFMPEANEEVITAADILAFLCAMYEQSPEVNEQTVRAWCDASIQMEKRWVADNQSTVNDPYLQLIRSTFDKLECVARQYPDFWGND